MYASDAGNPNFELDERKNGRTAATEEQTYSLFRIMCRVDQESTTMPMKVVISGGGIAANVFLRQLRRLMDSGDLPKINVRAYEKRSKLKASPPGLNVLMNHNGMETLKECDNELFEEIVANGIPCPNWSACSMSGDVMYDMEDVVKNGMTGTVATLARWDVFHKATRVDDLTEFCSEIVKVEEDKDEDPESKKLKVLVRRYEDEDSTVVAEEDWIKGVDLAVGCGGRYCSLRAQLAPPVSYYGPPYVTDFRIVTHGFPAEKLNRLLPPEKPLWRVYHKPSHPDFSVEDVDPSLKAAASACVRVGVMRLSDTSVGIFGNVPKKDEDQDYTLRNSEDLVKLFTPNTENGEDPPNELGQLVLDMLRDHGDEAHWTRKQMTDTCYSAMDDRVLFLGDSAGAIYPSLGQGANLSLEDAIVASALFPDVPKIATIRRARREFIKTMSLRHSEHVSYPEVFDREVYDWSNPNSIWCSYLLPRLWCGKQNALQAIDATPENIRPYGQLIAESLDGDVYGESTDAVLDLSNGIPRFYMMKLEGGRPLLVSQITCHKKVTQCLGVLGKDEDFYLVMHPPCDTPTVGGLQAFRIPPRHFIKLNVGTWHVGPMWTGPDLDRTFYNLELADTNIVDHVTLQLTDMLRGVGISTEGAGIHNEEDMDIQTLFNTESGRKVEIPIFPVPNSK